MSERLFNCLKQLFCRHNYELINILDVPSWKGGMQLHIHRKRCPKCEKCESDWMYY